MYISLLIFFTLVQLSFDVSAQTIGKCENGYQPLAGRCISNRMSDYIACVEVSGGGKQDFRDFIALKTKDASGGTGAAQGSGVIVKGSGSIQLQSSKEQEIIKLAEAKFFPGAMSECGKALPPIEAPKSATQEKSP